MRMIYFQLRRSVQFDREYYNNNNNRLYSKFKLYIVKLLTVIRLIEWNLHHSSRFGYRAYKQIQNKTCVEHKITTDLIQY